MMDTLTAILSWEFQVALSEKKICKQISFANFLKSHPKPSEPPQKNETILDGDCYCGWSPYEILTFFEFV